MNNTQRFILFITPLLLTAFLLTMKKKQSIETVICLAGDVMLGRTVNEIMQQKGIMYPWGNLPKILKQADCTLINLETALTMHTIKTPKVFNFKSLPEHAQSLKNAGITTVNLANNHIKDFGTPGLQETLQALEKANVAYTGAGLNEDHAKQPAIFKTKQGTTISIIGYTDNEPTWHATKTEPGINYTQINLNNMQSIIDHIKHIRPTVDILIISLHWGPNMLEYPLIEHISFAHALIDNGVDIIHGHSAHVLQGVEIYKNKLIIYDTGDTIDDYAVDPILRNDLSALFKITFIQNAIKSIQAIPIQIQNMQTTLATGQVKDQIITMLNKRSIQFHTLFAQDGYCKTYHR